MITYDTEENPVDKTDYKDRLQALIPLIDELDATIAEGDFVQAKSQYANLLNQWTDAEVVVREESVASYGKIETAMAFVNADLLEKLTHSLKRYGMRSVLFQQNMAQKIGVTHTDLKTAEILNETGPITAGELGSSRQRI